MEMELVLLLIGLSCLTVLFVEAEPMVLLKRVLGFKEENYTEYSIIKQFIFRLITCCLCSGFWIGLAFTQSIVYAGIVSVISEWLYNRLKNSSL